MPQPRNDQAVTLLEQDFQRRYEPNFAWANAVAAHLMLPGLRGFWPMSSSDSAASAYDLSGQGRTLASGGESSVVYDNSYFAPCVWLDGIGAWLERADEAGLDILGGEAYIAYPGVTLGAWVKFDNAIGATEYILSKQTAANAANCSYAILRLNTGVARFQIGNGAAVFETRDSVGTMSPDIWYHVVGRWIPSANISVFLDGVESSAGASGIATLANTAAGLFGGAYDPGSSLMGGYMSLDFLCCYALPTTTIQSLWQQTRALFNK